MSNNSKIQGVILAIVELNLKDVLTTRLMKIPIPKNIIVSIQPITPSQNLLDFSSSVNFIFLLPTINSMLDGGS